MFWFWGFSRLGKLRAYHFGSEKISEVDGGNGILFRASGQLI